MTPLTITLQSRGDYWTNSFSVLRQILRAPVTQPIILDKMHEGWSLQRAGLIEVLEKILMLTGRDRSTLRRRDRNAAEKHLPIENLDHSPHSHFFDLSSTYWTQDVPTVHCDAQRFGYFMGRPTLARALMFWHIHQHDWGPHFLLSRLRQQQPYLPWCDPRNYLDRPQDWLEPEEFQRFQQWWRQDFAVDSIDDLALEDQWNPDVDTRRSLLNLSPRWHMELVFETCTLAPSFLPTEKTVRPMVAHKPMLIYGPRGFLENLKKQGFLTWHDLWDETYDNLEHIPRFRALLHIINDILGMSDHQFQDLMYRANKICAHNKKHLWHLIQLHKMHSTK